MGSAYLDQDPHTMIIDTITLLNKSKNLEDAISNILKHIHQNTEIEAVATRLRIGNDYPYFSYEGFPDSFIKMENSLCVECQDGSILQDEEGNPILACMCGNIIEKRFDSKQPFFTEKGSFWTNSTTNLLANTTEDDRQGHTRNNCHGEGYESVGAKRLATGR